MVDKSSAWVRHLTRWQHIPLPVVGAWLPAALLALAQSYGAFHRPAGDRLADLDVYLGSVRSLTHGGSLYDFATGNGAPFTYPPFAGLLMAPLAYVGAQPLRIAWTAASLACSVVLATVLATQIRTTLPRRWLVPALAAILFASAPVSSGIRFGQVSLYLVVLVIMDATLMRDSRWHGVATGLAAAFKLTPLIFLPLLWLGNDKRGALRAAITAAAATGLAWLVLPADSARFWGLEIWDINRIGHILTGGNQSLNGALLRFGVGESARPVLMVAGGLAVAAVALWRGAVAARGGDWLSAIIVVGAASLVVSPVSWTHHQVWLILAAVLPVRGSRRTRVLWVVVVCMIMIAPVTSWGSHLPGVAGAIAGELRTALALVIACAVPLRARQSAERPTAGTACNVRVHGDDHPDRAGGAADRDRGGVRPAAGRLGVGLRRRLSIRTLQHVRRVERS